MVGATEDVHEGNQLKPSKQPVAPGIIYSPGVRAADALVGAPHMWGDLTLYPDERVSRGS